MEYFADVIMSRHQHSLNRSAKGCCQHFALGGRHEIVIGTMDQEDRTAH